MSTTTFDPWAVAMEQTMPKNIAPTATVVPIFNGESKICFTCGRPATHQACAAAVAVPCCQRQNCEAAAVEEAGKIASVTPGDPFFPGERWGTHTRHGFSGFPYVHEIHPSDD